MIHRLSLRLAIVVAVTFLVMDNPFAVTMANAQTSLKYPVSKNFLDRIKGMGFKWRNEDKPYRRTSRGVTGDFYLQEAEWFPVKEFRYVNENGQKRWEEKQGRFPYHRARFSVNFKTAYLDQYKHVSLESRAKPSKSRSQKYIQSLGSPPKTNQAEYEQVTETRYKSERRAGAMVERADEFKKHYEQWVARVIGGVPSGSLSLLVKHAGPIRTNVRIRYDYQVTRFGKQLDSVLIVDLDISNNINHPSSRRIAPESLIDAVFWAIAESVGNPALAVRPERPGKADTVLAPGPGKPDPGKPHPSHQPSKTPATVGPPKLPSKPTSPTGGVYGDVFDVLRQLNKVKEELVFLRAQLRALEVARQEEEEWLRSAQATLASIGNDSPHAAEYRQWIVESERKLAELLSETERLLEQGDGLWEGLSAELAKVIAKADGNEKLDELKQWPKSLAKLRQISKLELLLAGGQDDAFRRLLPAALNDKELHERATELQATWMIDQGKYAQALYALRKSTKEHPRNSTLSMLMVQLEVNYLKLISAKTFAESGRLRQAWNDYMVGTDRGYGMQIFTGGIKRGIHRLIGTTQFREALFKERVDYAAVQQNGVELMWRLRQKGLSFAQIKQLDTQSLREQFAAIAPNKKLSDDAVEEMVVSLMAAFMHPDVENLLSDNQRLMQVASDESYLGSDMLQAHGAEYALETVMDFTSVKNVLMIFGPMARIGNVSAIARFASRLFGGSATGSAASAERIAAMTTQEWIYARPALQRVAGHLATTRAGQAISESQHALRALRYDSSLPVRWTTGSGIFTGEVAANWLLAEGMGRIGHAVGGEYGQILGEVGSSFVGIPVSGKLANLEEGWQQSLRTMNQAKAQWEIKEAVLKTLRAPIQEATETVAAGRTLTRAQRTTLTSAASQLDELSAAATSAATRPVSPPAGVGDTAVDAAAGSAPAGAHLQQTMVDEANTLAANARAALAGNTDEALANAGAARTLREQARDLVETLDDSQQSLQQRLTSLESRRPAGGAADDLTMRPDRPATSSPPPPRPEPPPTKSPSYDELLARAEKALENNDFETAYRSLHTATKHPKAQRADVREVLKAKLAEAAGARRVARRMARRQASNAARTRRLAAEADQAMEPFSAAMMKHINTQTKANMKILPPEESAGGAHLIYDAARENFVAVWKPAKRNSPVLGKEGQMLAEVLMYKVGRKLGLRVPYAQPHVVDGELGVLIRWIPDSTELKEFSRGTQVALKQQIAEFRPLQVIMGNYDAHFGNYKVDRAGRLWVIDGGMSYLTPPKKDSVLYLRAQMFSNGTFQILDEYSHNINSTRGMRDLYAIVGRTDERYQAIERIDTLLNGVDMRTTARRARDLTSAEVRSMVDEAMAAAETAESRDAMELMISTLQERIEELPFLLNEHWSGALP